MQGLQDVETIDGDERQWMTAHDVAKMLLMTTAWVYAQTRANKIPYVRLGRYVRYRRSALHAWLAGIERGSQVATAPTGRRDAPFGPLGRRV